jgi:hypothetical protein
MQHDFQPHTPFVRSFVRSFLQIRNAQVPLQIIESSIPNADRGLTILEDVKANGTIHSIAEPLICVVHG